MARSIEIEVRTSSGIPMLPVQYEGHAVARANSGLLLASCLKDASSPNESAKTVNLDPTALFPMFSHVELTYLATQQLSSG